MSEQQSLSGSIGHTASPKTTLEVPEDLLRKQRLDVAHSGQNETDKRPKDTCTITFLFVCFSVFFSFFFSSLYL